MTESDIREIVKRALNNIAPEIDVDTIDPGKDLREQMDIDSVDFLNFVIGLHKELNIEIPDADVAKLATFNGCITYLTSRLTNLQTVRDPGHQSG
jgi:acyl carrier protein